MFNFYLKTLFLVNLWVVGLPEANMQRTRCFLASDLPRTKPIAKYNASPAPRGCAATFEFLKYALLLEEIVKKRVHVLTH